MKLTKITHLLLVSICTGPYLVDMSSQDPQVFVTVSQVETGEIVRRLGPYANAAAARRAVPAFTGQAMTWERTEETWRAEKYPLVYHVPADAPEVSG